MAAETKILRQFNTMTDKNWNYLEVVLNWYNIPFLINKKRENADLDF